MPYKNRGPKGGPGKNRGPQGGPGKPAGHKTDKPGRAGSRLQAGSQGMGPRRAGPWRPGSEDSEKSSEGKSGPGKGDAPRRGPGKGDAPRRGPGKGDAPRRSPGKGGTRNWDPKKGGPGKGDAPRRSPGKEGTRTWDPKKGGPGGKTHTRKEAGDESIRLNKYIAASGICSRREADQLITAGLVTVNGKSVTELGSKVQPDDDVRYNGKRIRNERKVYLLLNKPKDYVTTTDDPKERNTVMLLVRNACKERIYPVGRLDRNTTGVLLFTNDGEIAKKLTHPSYNKKKIYHIFLDKGVSGGDLKKLADGITLDDGFIQPDAISYVSGENKREIGLEIHSGRNRIVRRMFEHLGYRVTKLDRVYFAGLTKKNLPRGKWRFLTESEVNRLKMNAYE